MSTVPAGSDRARPKPPAERELACPAATAAVVVDRRGEACGAVVAELPASA